MNCKIWESLDVKNRAQLTLQGISVVLQRMLSAKSLSKVSKSNKLLKINHLTSRLSIIRKVSMLTDLHQESKLRRQSLLLQTKLSLNNLHSNYNIDQIAQKLFIHRTKTKQRASHISRSQKVSAVLTSYSEWEAPQGIQEHPRALTNRVIRLHPPFQKQTIVTNNSNYTKKITSCLLLVCLSLSPSKRMMTTPLESSTAICTRR